MGRDRIWYDGAARAEADVIERAAKDAATLLDDAVREYEADASHWGALTCGTSLETGSEAPGSKRPISAICFFASDASGFIVSPWHHFRHLGDVVFDATVHQSWCAHASMKRSGALHEGPSIVVGLAALELTEASRVSNAIHQVAGGFRERVRHAVAALLRLVEPNELPGIADHLRRALDAIDALERAKLDHLAMFCHGREDRSSRGA